METEFKITLGITNYQLTKAELASAIGAKTSIFRFLHILEKLQSPGKNKPYFRNPRSILNGSNVFKTNSRI